MILHRDVKITMYQLGYRPRHHYIRFAIVTLLLAGLIVGGIVAFRQIFRPDTILVQSNPIVRNVPVSNVETKHITKGDVSFDIPATWREQKPDQSTTTTLPLGTWQGTVKDDTARWLNVYIDTIPSDLAINHLLPVEADGDHLNVTDTTSDNCVNFTDKATTSSRTGTAPAKWSGVNFICDVGNYERDVVAIGSTEGVNKITVVGKVAGKHQVLLVYTDNSPNPDYTLFATIAKSFRVQ